MHSGEPTNRRTAVKCHGFFFGVNVVVIYRIVELDFQIMYFMFVIEKRSNMHM